nr:YihA family ribosome biogenesis GTP-binding protein [Desulfobulbaceae bacterium]
MVDYSQVEFLISAHALKQLPEPSLPEIAFAGRSNVGKSSLINKLVNRKKLVKVSARPGKTQALNFFTVQDSLYLVDLPGYGFAKVPKDVKGLWHKLIASYLESRESLCCVVVILDIRHPLKTLDQELIAWLKGIGVGYLPVYTKIDKVPRGKRHQHAASLDAGLGISPEERVLFSAKTGEGKEDLISCLANFMS